jgi:hypothetical protein
VEVEPVDAVPEEPLLESLLEEDELPTFVLVEPVTIPPVVFVEVRVEPDSPFTVGTDESDPLQAVSANNVISNK